MFMSIQTPNGRSKTQILGLWENTKRIPVALSKWGDECSGAISGLDFSGKRGETTRIGSVLLVGLG